MIIAQLSDPHICDEGVLYKGVAATNDMARAAVAHLNALDPAPDLVILTGDLTEDGTASQYAAARGILSELRAPLHAMPGNHDDREAFRSAFSTQAGMPPAGPIHFVVEAGPLRLVAVDVTISGAHHGYADDETLAWLAAVLDADRVTPTIIAMHHPPFACGIPYMDDYMCREPDRLAALIGRQTNVERVICGHVHRAMQRLWAGTLVTTSPSTATQIALALRPDAAPASYLEPPACLLHHWSAETGLITHVSPIGTFAGPFPFA